MELFLEPAELASISPSPFQVIWSELKNGLFIWPFKTSPGTCFAPPLNYVVPLIVILVATVGGIYLAGR
jgi:hypothetical protein